MPWEHLEHTGDIAIRVTAATYEELLAESARAMTEILVDPAAAQPQLLQDIVVEGEDPADLLRAWLSELLYWFSAGNMVFVEYNVVVPGGRMVRAKVRGEPFDPQRHPLRTELKAVTYHHLEAKQTANGWEGQVIFDV
jgi:SHS2 domain-containing protein